MQIFHKHPTIKRVVNEQFKLINENIRYEDIPEDGLIELKKKKIRWYEYYLFKDKEQYEQWKEWAIGMMKAACIEKDFDKIDMIYGLNYRLPQTEKEGQMALF